MKTSDKIVLGILVIIIIGLNGFLITASTGNDDTIVLSGSEHNYISSEQARQVALNAVPGEIVEFGLELEGETLVYEAEIESADGTKEVTIDRETGVILGIEEDDDEEIPQEELEAINGLISEEEAKQIALNYIGEGRVVDFESEREGGRILFEVELEVDGEEVEVEIDAETGEIIEVEWDDD